MKKIGDLPEIPNLKFQIPNNLQIPNPTTKTWFEILNLVLGICLLFGAWDLVLM
jgi:hypothetical protein